MFISESRIRKIIRQRLIKEITSGDEYAVDFVQPGSNFYGAGEIENSPSAAEISHAGTTETMVLDGVTITKKPGANIEDLSNDTKDLIKYMYEKAEKMDDVDTPVITSGMRGPLAQATVMYNNWEANGGLNGGEKYLVGLYAKKKLAKEISDIFKNNGPSSPGGSEDYAIDEARYVLENDPISNHAEGDAFDLRLTKGIIKLLTVLAAEDLIKVGDESKKPGPHYHVVVLKAPEQ